MPYRSVELVAEHQYAVRYAVQCEVQYAVQYAVKYAVQYAVNNAVQYAITPPDCMGVANFLSEKWKNTLNLFKQ